ncbi:MAG: polysaccharide pyruvyl transferase family protein, partial [Kiritimatiellia bacterium]|nr:polysaccharide pyruvyl transferase family protein [Kiritimatiellia bacterium]
MKPLILRTAWQTCNIGDICFTPAMCARLRSLLPERKIVCWAAQTTPAIRALTEAACPGVEWLVGELGRQGLPADPEVLDAFESAGSFLYNSGPLLQYAGGVQQWDYLAHNIAPLFLCREKGIPYSIYGQSMESLAPPADILTRDVFSRAEFITCRDTRSCRTLQTAGVRDDVIAFSPDIAFSYRQLNAEPADAFLKDQGLEPGRFLGFCCHYAVENRAPLSTRS